MKEEELQIIYDKIDRMFLKKYKQRVLYLVFLLNFILSFLCNVDHGSIPGSAREVKLKYKIDNLGFGLLGTVVYLGLTIGSILALKVYQKSTYIKQILLVSMSCNCFFLLAFALTSNYLLALFIRLITGFFQVFVIIFMPVWADAFGSEREKSIWITMF